MIIKHDIRTETCMRNQANISLIRELRFNRPWPRVSIFRGYDAMCPGPRLCSCPTDGFFWPESSLCDPLAHRLPSLQNPFVLRVQLMDVRCALHSDPCSSGRQHPISIQTSSSAWAGPSLPEQASDLNQVEQLFVKVISDFNNHRGAEPRRNKWQHGK